jgi:nucleoside 2-deoxyribosyltransferase
MSFDPTLDTAYTEGIQPAVSDCGFAPVRIDRVHHNEKICDRILAELRLAQFMVADFTLHRAGVYFEAGFAMGLGRPVIWTCRKDDLPNAHFDTRQYNHIEWETPSELRAKLVDRIRATIQR